MRDILEDDVPEKYFISGKMHSWLVKHSKKKQSEGCGFKFEPKDVSGKASAINQRCSKMGVDDNYLQVLGNLYVNNPQGGRVYSPDGKSACLNGEAGGLGGKSGLYAVCGASARIRRLTPLECERLQTVPDNSTLWGAVPLTIASQKRYAKSLHRGDAYIKGDLIYIKMKDSPRYKMLGNGWTRDAVAFFFSFMDFAVVETVKGSQLQSTLFDLMS